LCFDRRYVTGLIALDLTFGSLASLSEPVALFLCFDARRIIGTGTIALDPTFGSLTSLSEVVSLVEVFRLFRLEGIFLVFRKTQLQVKCTTSFYLLAGPVSF